MMNHKLTIAGTSLVALGSMALFLQGREAPKVDLPEVTSTIPIFDDADAEPATEYVLGPGCTLNADGTVSCDTLRSRLTSKVTERSRISRSSRDRHGLFGRRRDSCGGRRIVLLPRRR